MADAPTANSDDYIRRFDELGRGDADVAGGKGANLGEMLAADLPVPPGYAVTVDAYHRFYEANRLDEAIGERLERLDVDDPVQLRRTAESLQRLVRDAAVPPEVRESILDAYRELGSATHSDEPFVAVRSSATVEDTAAYSFAGMFESFLNVRGETALLEKVKDCWASTFGGRVLFYRIKQGMPREVPVAVAVQAMVDADKSGVLFTTDPATNDPNVLIIEAAWGLGEVVVGGEVEPDRYEFDERRESAVIHVGHKQFMRVRDERTGENVRVDLSDEKADERVLTDDEIATLADLGQRTEAHYGTPQDAEWAIEDGRVYLVQTRPITTLVERERRGEQAEREAREAEEEPHVLVHGRGASPGRASGAVRVLDSPDEGDRLEAGEVLVTERTAPDWVPIMRRAAAIVTDSGGLTSHAAIVSRELGLPCVVGARDATQMLQDGTVVTVDGASGTVIAGAEAEAAPAEAEAAAPGPGPAPTAAPVTATRLYVNLGEPERAEEIARRPVDGVGLLRAEFIIMSALEGRHPRLLLEQGKGDEFVDRLAGELVTFARAFQPRPVIYRTMDFKSNEFRHLEGGERFEPEEANPMIGYRGCWRYTREPDLFALELRALARVREDYGNLHLMIPFVRTLSEFRTCKRQIDESALGDDAGLELWVMAEVPSIVSWLEDYVALGVTGVSIGSNDLTQLVLGVDRDSEILAPLYDERDRAVLDAIEAIIRECRRLDVTCSICGQAPSVHARYAGTLVRWGIDSISVNPDAIDATRQNIAVAEQKLLLDAARGEG